VKNADVVLVVEKGRVAEQGTHDELVKAGGIYHKLIQYQLTPD
jgi:ABC-type multidrug transport system fused ATPase/permease subunit